MKRKINLGWSMLLLLFACSCSEEPYDPGLVRPTWIRGKVIDEEGLAVPNAAILMTYGLSRKSSRTQPAKSTLSRNDLPDTLEVQTRIVDSCRDETVRFISEVRAILEPLFLIWDGRDDDGKLVFPGPYDFQMDYSDTTVFGEIFFAPRSYPAEADPAAYRHFTKTNTNGLFEFSQECLAFGQEITLLDEPGAPGDVITVPRYVKVWAIHEDYLTGVTEDSVFVDPEVGAQVTIELRVPEE